MSREESEGPVLEAAGGDGPFPEGPVGDEPPGRDPNRPCAEPALGPRASLYFASLDATVEGLQQELLDVCKRIDDNRQEDQMLLSSLRESLLQKVSELLGQLEVQHFYLYSFNNDMILELLQAVTEVMQRMIKLEEMLHHICCTMEEAYWDRCLPPKA